MFFISTLRTKELIGFATVDILELFLANYVENRVLDVDAFVNVICYSTRKKRKMT